MLRAGAEERDCIRCGARARKHDPDFTRYPLVRHERTGEIFRPISLSDPTADIGTATELLGSTALTIDLHQSSCGSH
jgi:hypothetical protein